MGGKIGLISGFRLSQLIRSIPPTISRLIDDEKFIIDVVRKALILVGYQVLAANRGEEAVEIYRKNEKPIALVILDMTMPVIGGTKVYALLKEINPKVKVILSSGSSIDSEA